MPETTTALDQTQEKSNGTRKGHFPKFKVCISSVISLETEMLPCEILAGFWPGKLLS